MIDEALLQLRNSTSTMIVSFVLVSGQQNVYNEFVMYLQRVSQTSPRTTTTAKASSKSKPPAPARIAYDEKSSSSEIFCSFSIEIFSSAVQITLISANKDHLVKCKQDIMDLSRSASHSSRLTDKQDMIHWPQSTIQNYYTYCLKQHVIPTLNFENCTIELVGPKEAVIDCDFICID